VKRRLRRTVRRIARVTGGAAAAALACALIAAGVVDPARLGADAPHPFAIAGVAAIVALVVAAVARRARFVEPAARAQRASGLLRAAVDFADVELALALVAGMYTLIIVTGGATSPTYPLLYGLIAFAATVMARPGAVAAVGAAVLLEASGWARAGDLRAAAIPAATHIVFIAGAAAAHALLLRGLVARNRRRRALRLADELRAQLESARDYRLIAAPLGPTSRAPRAREDEERLLAIGGVGIIADTAAWVLTTLKRSLAADSVALLWLDDDGERLRLKEIVSDADDIAGEARVFSGGGSKRFESRRLDGAGVLGAVIRDRQPLLCAVTKPGQIPYYETGRAGQAVVAVPVMDGPHLRGVVCADRGAPFDEKDRDLLGDAGHQLLRAVQAEQVFRAVERAKYEHERFYQATARLARALSPEQVMETAFDAASAIADYDAAVIALYDRDKGKHRIAAIRVGPGGAGILDVEAMTGLEFKDNAGLASMVVKNRHYLPAAGEPREVSAPVYTRKVKLDDAKSLLVLPLLSADEPVGTMMLAARTDKRFGKDVREMLAVIANQVAVSLENGLLYRKMETMATTDGLTGLTNHRSFQERFGDLLERAARHGHKAAVLLCDVDHFKKVNDTYGHPQGDEVLRRVARVLQELARKIDITARYGGEEFAVVLDNADVHQARTVAERIRQEIGKIVVETDKGPLSITESIGVAAFPDDGGDRATLIERADLALYHAKDTGRNRVVTYQEFQRQRGQKAS
jgi:two-component system cell cycle response regulator